ncbi:MAG: arginase family protein [Candidatus Aenigmarchaeota archaeon]|nr:arginase family protein [Candidatus Aenigmarchaeota archaeon]
MNFILIGLPYDETQTCRKGASKAPNMIRNIFPLLETYIDGIDLSEHFIEDLGNFSKDNLNEIDINKFPIILGGEHSITEWMVDKLKPDNVVIFDAHADCEDSEKHDGVIRRIAEKGFNVYLVKQGFRCMSKEEKKYLDTNKIKIIDIQDLKNIKGKIYLSIDLDVLDPSILPTVGNPEPDGLKFKELIEYIKPIIPNLIGFDVVEFTPFEKDNETYLIIVGKLIYKIMSEVVKR